MISALELRCNTLHGHFVTSIVLTLSLSCIHICTRTHAHTLKISKRDVIQDPTISIHADWEIVSDFIRIFHEFAIYEVMAQHFVSQVHNVSRS